MILITVDRGNSTWDLAVHARADGGAAGELIGRERVAVDQPDRLRDQLGAWRDAFGAAGDLVASSVVVDGLEPLREILAADDPSAALHIAGRDLPCPLVTDYPDPSTLGVDRWLGALAAHARFGAAVTVDCGTALTVNLIDASGRFRGGAIGPGATTMARGLALRAPGLPITGAWSSAISHPGDRPERGGPIPVDSAVAVTTGVALAFCGAVERLVRDLCLGAGLASPTRVLTGGEAGVYREHGLLSFEYVPDLVHRGLAQLWRTRPSNS